MWTWLEGKRTYVLAGLGMAASVLAMTSGWITTKDGAELAWLSAIAASLRAAIAALQSELGGAK